MSREIYRRTIAPHNSRVATDSGTPPDNIQAAILLARDSQEWIGRDKYLCISPELFGYKTRTSAPYNYATKVYSANSPQSGSGNDLSQTTANSQPYLDKISPIEYQCLKGTNGDNRVMSLTQISFTNAEKWSIELVLQLNGNSAAGTRGCILGTSDGNNFFRCFSGASNYLTFKNSLGETNFGVIPVNARIGKIITVHYVATGSNIKVYVNGSLYANANADTAFVINQIMSTGGGSFYGKIYQFSVIPEELTAARVLSRYSILRAIFPEIPTVRIAGLDVSCRALDITVTPAGNSIANVTDNAAWGALTTGAWCHHSNDLAYGSTYNKMYNGYARTTLKNDLLSSAYGYHIATEAELTGLMASGLALKEMGTGHWTTANGTNVTGMTLLGGASRNTDGTFAAIKGSVMFWCGDSDKCLTLLDDGTISIDAKDLKTGAYIILIKN